MLRTLAAGDYAIVTVNADPLHMTMIHRSGSQWCPQRWELGMTGIATIGTGNMRRRFTAGVNAVVTQRAIGDKIGVIHTGGYPRRPGVAIIALL